MSKQEDNNFLKIQTCVLKVNIHCDGCKLKVKKLLHKIDGVYTTTIDAEQGKVTVSGNVDPAILIKKLEKSGKHAELFAPKPNSNNGNQKQLQAVAHCGKGQEQKDNGKPQNQKGGGGRAGKDQMKGGHQLLASLPPQQQQQLQLQQLQRQQLQQQQLQQLQQMKGFKDVKLPDLKDLKFPFHKDPKSVKFSLPPEEDGSDFDDFDDYDNDDDDDDFDDMDCFDADFDDNFKTLKIDKPMNGNGMKGGGGGNGVVNAKKVEIPVQNKGANNNGGGCGGKNGNGGKNGAGPQDAKNGGSNNNGKHKNAPNGNGGNNNNIKDGGGGKNDPGGMGHPMNHPNPNPNMMMMGQHFRGMGPPQPMGGVPTAVQGVPAGSMVPPSYFQGQVAAVANPYQQQQYMQVMIQQQQLQQQQRMMMMNGQDQMYHYQPMMGYPQPPMQAMYLPPRSPPQSEPYTHLFSDENTNSCSIM